MWRAVVPVLFCMAFGFTPAFAAGPSVAIFDTEGQISAADFGENWATWDSTNDGIIDNYEFALLSAILNDVDAPHHTTVQNAWDAALAQIQADLPTVSDRWNVGAGWMIMSTAEAVSVANALPLLGLPSIDPADYMQLDAILGPNGDVDGDGATNRSEFIVSTSRENYVDTALDPNVVPFDRASRLLGQIGGATVALHILGDYVYASEGAGLRILDISQFPAVEPRGFFATDGLVVDIEAEGTRVYAVDAALNLYIVDVTDPDNPVQITRLGTGTLVEDLDLENGLLVLGHLNGTLNIYDVTLAEALGPVLKLTANDLGFTGFIWTVNLAGSKLVVTANEPTGLSIYDLADLDAPELLGFAPTPLPIQYAALANDILYGGMENNDNPDELIIFDLSDPTQPTELSRTLTPASPRFEFHDMDIRGTTLFATAPGVFAYFDVADPSNPSLTFTTGGGLVEPRYVRAFGDFVALAHGSPNILFWDVSDLQNPSIISTHDTLGAPRQIEVVGNYAYIAASLRSPFDDGGLWVLDVANPRAIEIVGGANDFDAEGLAVSGNLGYVVGRSGLGIYDITDPSAPFQLSVTPSPDNGRDVVLEGIYAFVAQEDAGLEIYDVSTPASPVLISAIGTTGPAEGLHVEGNRVYLATQSFGLEIVDVSDIASPTVLGQLDLPGESSAVTVAQTTAYVAAGSAGLRVIDVTNGASPAEISVVPTSGDARGITVSEGLAYVSHLRGVQIVDVAVPTTPVTLANVETPGSTPVFPSDARDIPGPVDVFIGKETFVAGGWNGLTVVPTPPAAPEISSVVPSFIDADTLTIAGTAAAGSFVTAGGGEEPAFQQLASGQVAFSFDVKLRQEAINDIRVRTMNEFGLLSLAAALPVVEGVAFPASVETVTALAISPDPAPNVPLNGSLKLSATATFSDSSNADVTEFVVWEELSNGELITTAGLYVNSKLGPGSIRAFGGGVFSNTVVVSDSP